MKCQIAHIYHKRKTPELITVSSKSLIVVFVELSSDIILISYKWIYRVKDSTIAFLKKRSQRFPVHFILDFILD